MRSCPGWRCCYVLLLLIITILYSNCAFAQNQNQIVENTLASMFEYLDTSKVPTGYLKDKAFELVDFAQYNGINQSADLSPDRSILYASVRTINTARVKPSLPLYNADNYISSFNDPTGVVIGATLFKYNYIVQNAISDTLIVYQNGKVYDSYVNGIWRNPYSDAYSLVFAPSISVHTGQDVRFKFSTNQLLTNCQVQTIEFDPEDDGTYTTLGSTYNQVIHYSTTGTKVLRLRITLDGGIVLLAHTTIDVLADDNSHAHLLPSGASSPFRVYLDNDETSPTYAIITYRYASSHNSQLVKPLIYVEGFDHPLMGWLSTFSANNLEERIEELVKYALLSAAGFSRGAYDYYWLNDKLSSAPYITDEFDIVYVDWGNPMASIMDNARLLEQIITSINNSKTVHDDSTKNTIIGHSMGGVIARVALCNMESNPLIHHETKCYVSFDSPHKGANIPLGLQFAFRDLGKILDNIIGQSIITNNNTLVLLALYNEVLSCMQSASASQMMYYQVQDDYSICDNNNWQAFLDDLGFPKGDPGCPIENLAIFNGGAPDTTTDPLMNLYVNVENQFSQSQVLLWLLTWLSNISISFQINHNRGDSGIVDNSSAYYKKKFLCFPEKTIYLLGDNNETIITHNSDNWMLDYDVIQGSSLSTIDTTYGTGNNILSIGINSFPFIPVASALSTEYYHRDYRNNQPHPLEDIPFSSYYFPQSREKHQHVDSTYFSWIYRQSNMAIIGPTGFAKTGDTFSIQRVGTDYSNGKWSTSDSLVAHFSGDSLVVLNPGPVRITYSCTDQNDSRVKYYKHRNVFAGIPEMALSKDNNGNGTYTVSATCVNPSIRAAFAQSVADSTFTYRWGRKVGHGSIQWESSTTLSSDYSCQSVEDEYISVFLKIVTKTGIESPVYSILVQKGNYDCFYHDPQGIYSDAHYIFHDYQFATTFMLESGRHFRPMFSLCLWRNESVPSSYVPDMVRIGDQSFPLYSSTIVYDGLTPITVYEFLIMSSTQIQNTISEIHSSYNTNFPYLGDFVDIDVICDDEVVQTIILPVFRLNF